MDKAKDKGHLRLIADIESLLDAANNHVFHDYKSNEAAPKMELKAWCNTMIENLIEGKYDN